MTPIDRLKRHRSVLKLQKHLNSKLKQLSTGIRKRQTGRWLKGLFSRKSKSPSKSKPKKNTERPKGSMNLDHNLNNMRRLQRKRFTEYDLGLRRMGSMTPDVSKFRRANTHNLGTQGTLIFGCNGG